MSFSPGATRRKDPDARLIYAVDWSAWLASGALIADSQWTVTGDGAPPTFDNPSVVGGTKTQARFSGGEAGKRFLVTNRITTNETPAQTDDRSFYFTDSGSLIRVIDDCRASVRRF